MKLDNYIGDLLFKHDCVIVSDFGGFVANYKSASVHPVQHTFTPPAKQVAFNESLKNNDGLLANYISNRLLISYPDAVRLINEFVNASNIKLAINNKLVIESVGELFYDYEKNLQFVPDEKVNYLLDSFGLGAIQSPAIKREKGYEIFKGDEEFAAKILPAAKKRKLIKPLLRIISVTGVAALITWAYFNPTISGTISKGLAGINLFENKQENQLQNNNVGTNDFPRPVENNQPVVLTTPKDQPVTIETNSPTQTEIIPSALPETKEVIEVAKETAPIIKEEPAVLKKETVEKEPLKISAINTEAGNYFIIGGCFGVHENAVKLSEELKTKGFPSQLLGKGKKGLEIVSISSAASRSKAEEMLGFIQESGYPDAWIMKK